MARHGFGGVGLKPPKNKNIAPKRNEAHWPFWAWAHVFCKIYLKKVNTFDNI